MRGALADIDKLREAGRLPEVERALRGILAAAAAAGSPRPVPVLLRLARVLIERGEAERAYAVADEAAALEPASPTALNLRGAALGLVGRSAEAAAVFRRVLAIDPASAEASLNLGCLLSAHGRAAEAIDILRRALDLAPGRGQARRALAAALRDEGRTAEALAELDRVASAAEAEAWLHDERGILLTMARRPREAIAAFGRAIAAGPELGALYNRAVAFLLLGDFRRGWAEYEHRFRSGAVPSPAYPWPRWRGEPIEGKRILLWGEQGQGDVLQFVRYAPLVAARGARVTLAVPRSLVRLLRSLDGVENVVAFEERLDAQDLHAPLMSLPALFGTTLTTIPATIPYLAADPSLRRRWARRLPDDGRPRVGLVWAGHAGSPKPAARAADRRRSIGLDHLRLLLELKGIRFVSLQLGAGRADLRAAGSGVEELLCDPMAEVRDFADTAAIVDQLDLVISVDTSVAHLAGALGRPVWVLSRHDGCFRWLLDRDDSPWYPTMRLFRQQVPGDWKGVVARVGAALRSVVALGTGDLMTV